MEYTLHGYYTLIAAVLVLLLGRFMVLKIDLLRRYNIPEPVVGGLVAAALAYVLHATFGLSAKFSQDLQTTFMLIFFTSIGLGANIAKLFAGGRSLVIFLLCIVGFILVQNTVGMGSAKMLGLDPLIGLVAGSITLTGGHGTAGAWGEILENKYGITGATTLGMASATFGLIIGGLVGGPVAKYLIERNHLAKAKPLAQVLKEDLQPLGRSADSLAFEYPHQMRYITADNAISTLGMFAACLAFALLMADFSKDSMFELPTFVWALAGGVILRNTLEAGLKVEIFDRAIDVFGNASLGLYLAMALLSLKLWLLSDLAGPLVLILVLQTLAMVAYTAFVTFKVMGSDYDAAILAAGHCGFGMGATPTAIANMQAVTNMYGPSHKAFLIVPLVGAFFIDIINAFAIQMSLKIFG